VYASPKAGHRSIMTGPGAFSARMVR
jgi:hypothetical protein